MSSLRLLAAALACALAGCGAAARPIDAVDTPAFAAPPDFELPALDGGSVRLAEHLGKDVVLIDFWATYCEPCLRALPHLDELYRKYKGRGFVVLGISIDEASAIGRVRTEAAKLGLTFPVLLDADTRVIARYNPKSSAPYSVLIGRDGRVLRRQEGYTTGDRATLNSEVLAALE